MGSRAQLVILTMLLTVLAVGTNAAEPGWGYYGGDQGGQRYSTATQITPANVALLKEAWRFSTGDLATKRDAMSHASFEDTPILADSRIYVCSPFSELSALDPGTGKQLWRYDPRIDPTLGYTNDNVCRGVAVFRHGIRTPF